MERKKGLFGWFFGHVSDGAGRGISDIVRYAIFIVVVLVVVGILGLTISKVTIGGVEVQAQQKPSNDVADNQVTSNQSADTNFSCPNISDGYNKVFVMQEGGYYDDSNAFYGNTGHYMYYLSQWSIEIGATYFGHSTTYVNPLSLVSGIWMNVHPYSNGLGALAMCKDNGGTYGAIVPYNF